MKDLKLAALSKEAPQNEIKQYFKAVLDLRKSGDEFPVDLDEVWQLVYANKNEAVRALKNNEAIIEGFDYQFFSKNAENSKIGRPTDAYMLSVNCMEWFIAKKVRAVFEVYRSVFHQVIEIGQLASNSSDMSVYDYRLSNIERNIDKLANLPPHTHPDIHKVIEAMSVDEKYRVGSRLSRKGFTLKAISEMLNIQYYLVSAWAKEWANYQAPLPIKFPQSIHNLILDCSPKGTRKKLYSEVEVLIKQINNQLMVGGM